MGIKPPDEDLRSRGWEARRVRDSCCIPLAWNIPNDKQIGRVLRKISDYLAHEPAALEPKKLQGALLVLLALQTARPAEELLKAQYRQGEELLKMSASEIGVGKYEDLPVVSLPTAQQERDPALVPRLPRILLPQAKLVSNILEEMGREDGEGGPIFTLDHDTIKEHARRFSHGGRYSKRETSKATRGLKAMHRWQRYKLREAAMGDNGMTAILNPDLSAAERAIRHYLAVPLEDFWNTYCRGLRVLFDWPLPKCPLNLAGSFVGTGHVPDSIKLRSSINDLRRILHQPIINPYLAKKPAQKRLGPTQIAYERHLAMMVYTFALATFGTGQRHKGTICAFDDIEPETGWAWVTEKVNKMYASPGRGVLHSPRVVQQLRYYEKYLDIVENCFALENETLAADLRGLRKKPGLCFFKVWHGRLIELTPLQLCRSASAIGWNYSPNIGRHWLRSQLMFEVPGDALAAQFGHRHAGIDVWGIYSGMNPLAVRSSLVPAIENLLHREGFVPDGMSANCLDERYKRDTRWDALETGYRKAQGQLIASAIWNGAFLNHNLERELAVEMRSTLHTGNLSSDWLELDVDRPTHGTAWWHIDSCTRELLVSYIDRHDNPKLRIVSSHIDRVLACFLGSPAQLAEFRKQAEVRWRVRMPPILFAKARGELENWSLPREHFTGLYSSKNLLKGDQTVQSRGSKEKFGEVRCISYRLRDLIWEAWEATSGLPFERKAKCYRCLSGKLAEDDFFQDASALERSIISGLVNLLQAERPYGQPRGFSAFAICEKIERIWRHFLPVTEDREPWEEATLSAIAPSTIFTMARKSRVQYPNVIADIETLLQPFGTALKRLKDYEEFPNLRQNRTVQYVHADEFAGFFTSNLEGGLQHFDRIAFSLMYYAGIRIGELANIYDWSFREGPRGELTLVIDKSLSRSLKTHSSRRCIPLDVLLPKQDLAFLKQQRKLTRLRRKQDRPKGMVRLNVLLEKQADHQYLFDYKTFDARSIFEKFNRVIERSDASAYAMRHTAATNLLAVLLRPVGAHPVGNNQLDPFVIKNSERIRRRLVGVHSLGALGPHALGTLIGHTSPWRTLFSYAHDLEVLVADYVMQNTVLGRERRQHPLALGQTKQIEGSYHAGSITVADKEAA